MKKFIAALLTFVSAFVLFAACSSKPSIVIVSSAEDFRNTEIKKMLDAKFPQYNIDLQYMSTGSSAAKLKSEGEQSQTDIILALEVSYLKQNSDILADLSSFDNTVFIQNVLSEDNTYLPWERYSGCVAIREDILKEKGLEIPKSFEDLTKPEYKGLISMPNPKASGTGYMLLLGLVNAWGEEKALKYFDELAPNVLQFTSSGSGPVNALVQKEAAIGLAMTFQTVTEINNNVPLTCAFFQEGAPYAVTGSAIIKGKENNAAVKEVFDYLITEVNKFDKKEFSPEPIFMGQQIEMTNYPKDIKYMDMNTETPVERKEELLNKWKY